MNRQRDHLAIPTGAPRADATSARHGATFGQLRWLRLVMAPAPAPLDHYDRECLVDNRNQVVCVLLQGPIARKRLGCIPYFEEGPTFR